MLGVSGACWPVVHTHTHLGLPGGFSVMRQVLGITRCCSWWDLQEYLGMAACFSQNLSEAGKSCSKVDWLIKVVLPA